MDHYNTGDLISVRLEDEVFYRIRQVAKPMEGTEVIGSITLEPLFENEVADMGKLVIPYDLFASMLDSSNITYYRQRSNVPA